MNEPVRFRNVTVKRSTDKALLCIWDGEEHWVPKSMIHDDSEVFEDTDGANEGTLVVKYWWAEQAGLV